MKPAFRDNIAAVYEIDITANQLAAALLNLASGETVCLLDSCGVGRHGSNLLIAGIDPEETFEFTGSSAGETLDLLDKKLSGNLASIFTISYDFSIKLLDIPSKNYPSDSASEPDVFLAFFDVLIVHDYDTGISFLTGNAEKFESVTKKLKSNISDPKSDILHKTPDISSNFTRTAYLQAIEMIRERIRQGDTYQTNLTRQLTARLPDELTPEIIFGRLRRDNPAPFSAFIKRPYSTVVSASPELFFRIEQRRGPVAAHSGDETKFRSIMTSPIKGTRRRGTTIAEDNALRQELLDSRKDRAENTMIVDLLRNDLGRVCEYGSVRVKNLCQIDEHPTLFHLVSTITGDLRSDVDFSEILKAIFPCGSITGAPKISTMKIIDEIEPVRRGLSMGAIGCYIPKSKGVGADLNALDTGRWAFLGPGIEMSVAIRTMVIRGNTATYNVGGGIVIDSDPESEYQETITKAQALLSAINGPRP